MRTIAIINQKGGCGKTTTAINLSACLAEQGKRVLLIDLDPQSHCAAGLAVPEKQIDQDISDALLAPTDRRLDAKRLVWRIAHNLDLLPSRTRLAAVEAPGGPLASEPEPERRLTSVLERLGVADSHDICVLDCSPSIGLLTYNALAAATETLIPVETSYFSLLGAQKQRRTIRSVSRRLGMRHPTRMLATIHDPTRPLARDLFDELARQFGPDLIPAPIRMDPRLPEAASFGRPITEYDDHSNGCADYRSLAVWLLEASSSNASGSDEDESRDEGPDVTVVQSDPPRIRTRPSNGTVSHAESIAATEDEVGSEFDADLIENGEITASVAAIAAQAATLSRAADVSRRAMGRRGTIENPRYRVRAVSGPLRLIEEIQDSAPMQAQRSSVERLFGARAAGQRIMFVQPIELGRRVHVAGTFNNWDPISHAMRHNDELGIHELALDVEPGIHEYRLVVDGRWIDDPHAAETHKNDFGGYNAIVRVTGPEKAR